MFHPSAASKALLKADFDTRNDLIFRKYYCIDHRDHREQDNFMQGGPVALMQYV